MNFNNILNQIGEVEKSGKFDSTTSSYFNYIDVNGTDVPPSTNNVSNQPYIHNDKDYINAWNQYSVEQAKLAREFQRQNPDVDMAKIYTDLRDRGFTNSQSSEVAAELRRLYGDRYLTPEQVEATSPNYYDISNKLKIGDIENKQKNYFDSKGIKEQGVTKEKVGYENLIQLRQKEGDKPYDEYFRQLEQEKINKEQLEKDIKNKR